MNDLFRSIFDTLDEQIAVLDHTGTIIAVNETWERFARLGGAPIADGFKGSNYLEVCRVASLQGAEEAEACYRGLKMVLDAQRARFELEYPCHTPSQQRWFTMRAAPLYCEGCVKPHVVVTHRDITVRREAETTARRAASVQRVLLQLTNDLLTNEVTPALYQRLLEQAVDLIPHAQRGSILVRQADERFHFLAAQGFDLPSLRAVSLAEDELYYAAEGEQRRASYLVREIDRTNLVVLDPERLGLLREAGASSQIEVALAVPIYEDSEVVALLALDNLDDADAFDEVDRQLAEALGAQIGLVFQRLRSEARVRGNEQRLRLHREQTPLAVIEWDTNARVTAWNLAAEAMFGYRAEAVLGTKSIDLIVPEHIRPQIDEVLTALIENRGGYRSTNENVTKEGRIILCDWYNTPLVDDEGEVVGVASLAQDITERVAAEARFRKVFEAAPVAASITRLADGVLLEVNAAFCELTGYTRDETLGRTRRMLGLSAEPRDFHQLFTDLEAAGSLHDLEPRVRTKSGEVRDLLGSLVMLEFNGERCALGMSLDVSDRKRTQEQLSQAIQEVLNDSSWFGRAVMERLINIKAGSASPAEVADLTGREREVLTLLAQGLSNPQIGERLGIRKATVRNYVSTIYSKLELSSRAEAVVWARERGMVV